LRCGWAGSAPATRENTGCTFYGIANMSDNLFEITISVASSDGRLLERTNHGDGNLTSNGDHDATTWTTNASAFQKRGAAYNTFCYGIAYRNVLGVSGTRNSAEGFRCVRTF
jgi:hypothetical protein